MGRPVIIQSALKPFRKLGNNWNKVLWPFLDKPNHLKRWIGPTVTLFDGLFVIKYKINVSKTLIQVFTLCYQNLESISYIIFKLSAFLQRRHFGNFRQFFHQNFRLRWKFLNLMVPSDRSTSDVSEYTLFRIWKIIFVNKNQVLVVKLTFFYFLKPITQSPSTLRHLFTK